MREPPKGRRCHKHFPRVHFKSVGRAGCLLGTPMAGWPLAPKQGPAGASPWGPKASISWPPHWELKAQ
jgi:hypothetical protein